MFPAEIGYLCVTGRSVGAAYVTRHNIQRPSSASQIRHYWLGEVVNSVTNPRDDPGGLMTEQHRQRSYPVAVHHRQVGVADTARLDANHDLTAARIVQLRLDDAEWAGFSVWAGQADSVQHGAPDVNHGGIQA